LESSLPGSNSIAADRACSPAVADPEKDAVCRRMRERGRSEGMCERLNGAARESGINSRLRF
jgi:hypothetical protein